MRPCIHFTPQKGWINDPNGLILVGDTYHVFFQHYPDDTKWGPMHWGHATSKDLIHFEEQEIALFPTEEEYIFSGSAILDVDNKSGLGVDEKPAILLFYTSHNPKTGEQMQSLAYSTDYLHFEKYRNNPIVKNEKNAEDYKPDYRDPKVFCNSILGGFSMALAAGDHIEFLHSDNLIDWTPTGTFCPAGIGYAGLCECPDYIEMQYQGQTVSVLTMSMIFKEEGKAKETHIMQYFIGSFDGASFQSKQPFDKNMRLDFGEDHYAAVSFSGTETPLILGWGEDWNKARENNATTYFGKMTLARKLELRECEGKLYLSQQPVVTVETGAENVWKKEIHLGTGESIRISPQLAIKNSGKNLLLNDIEVPRIHAEAACNITVICDCGYYEIFADDGTISFSQSI
ncbi:MAG: glycoside hydrolase family 32 protein [Lachnospiraceae bacterium]|nr:glycoside hydrolase family 32 protein [Lachnospiraceae bacterium]